MTPLFTFSCMHGTVLIVVSQHHAVRKQTLGRAEAQRVMAVLLLEVLPTVVQVLLHRLRSAELLPSGL